MFLNIAMQIKDQFYKLIALGLGCVYGVQVFLNVGGVIKLYSVHRTNTSVGQLRRKFHFVYYCHVCHYSGTVYYAAGRRRRIE